MSISFWFRYEIPSIALIFVCESVDDVCPDSVCKPLDIILIINSKLQRKKNVISTKYETKPDHTYLFDLKLLEGNLDSILDKSLSKGEWIRVEVTFALRRKITSPGWIIKESGIHVFQQQNSMEDILFTSPF